jgi:hypothetical protein
MILNVIDDARHVQQRTHLLLLQLVLQYGRLEFVRRSVVRLFAIAIAIASTITITSTSAFGACDGADVEPLGDLLLEFGAMLGHAHLFRHPVHALLWPQALECRQPPVPPHGLALCFTRR